MTPEEEAAQASAVAAEAEETARAEREAQELEEEKEPGGDSPDNIRARKEYRARKKLETELRTEHERGIALEARVNTLQEIATKRVDPLPVVERRLTSAEAWRKVDAGEWTREGATEYIADTRYAENRSREKAEDKAAQEILAPFEKAKKEALEYVSLVPSLANRTHPKWGEIMNEVNRLLSEGGVRTRTQAEREALRTILGPIDQIREKQRMTTIRPAGDPHVETRGGGGGGSLSNKKDSFPDIPIHVKELWDKFGTSEKDRVTEAKYYRENKTARLR